MGEFKEPDVGFAFAADPYFVIEVPDGESLHVTLANKCLRRHFAKPHESESCLYIDFRCVGDGRGRGYFFDRAVLGEGGTPKTHTWTVEYTDRDGNTRQSRFDGALSNYRERQRSHSEWAFLGTIEIRLPY